MSTSNEKAMRLALEALEDIGQMQNHSNNGDSSDVDKAIKAIEEALAQSHSDVKQEQKPARLTSDRKWKLRNAFWRMYNHGKNDNPVSAQCEVQALDMFFAGDAINAWTTTVVPLYTTPQQRKPLTFEQVESCFPEGTSVFEDPYGDKQTSPRWLHAFARAIEAAHGIRPSDFKEQL